jgi:hypothetical protein
MEEAREGKDLSRGSDACLAISLRSEASHIRASDGRDIPFTRAVLTVRNGCATEVSGVVLHATLGQEGGTVQDVTHALSRPDAASMPPDGTVSWYVYDLLLPAHPGTASKIHMFGYRAVLNWLFDLTVWADYRVAGSAGPAQTPASRWTLRWSVADPSTGAVALAIDEAEK